MEPTNRRRRVYMNIGDFLKTSKSVIAQQLMRNAVQKGDL